MKKYSISETLPPRIDPGTFDVMLSEFYTAMMFQGKAPKLICVFTIVEQGPCFGKQLPRFYNVSRIIGKEGKGGRFKASATGDFAREFYTLFQASDVRLDRIPMSKFNGVTLRADVALVTRARGQRIPTPLQYSKILRLTKVVDT